jgi:hypothetical protein
MNVKMYLNYGQLLALDSVFVHKLRVPDASPKLNGAKQALSHWAINNITYFSKIVSYHGFL